ncbi:hypothetical protein BZL29_7918 [Mycobacterium kansasii]|uniref:Uncharacterized protein n=1 Tax=Mycobacterium kansasii TaxID=1768 RepID=A0A1V3WF49_MYCKA|nr:hypothetical protein BZL29_7918 [Mycobacterium kansasii]
MNFSEMMRALVTVGPSSPHRPQRPSTGEGASTVGRPAATQAAAAGSESMLAPRYVRFGCYRDRHETHTGVG